ncbi:MAG: glycosyltransferase, partial [Thaumarchaeota archaeon]|nr:glycosyltransferase [Nitrososphaerota archaeon]
MKLVGIPAYNEEGTIGDIVKRSLYHSDKVIVVDDGSSDNTAQVAKQSGATVI